MEHSWWIEEGLFNEIRRVMPIAAVDLLVVYEGRLLLMLRNNEPVKDVWFTPGGRVRLGETLEQACLRKRERSSTWYSNLNMYMYMSL